MFLKCRIESIEKLKSKKTLIFWPKNICWPNKKGWPNHTKFNVAFGQWPKHIKFNVAFGQWPNHINYFYCIRPIFFGPNRTVFGRSTSVTSCFCNPFFRQFAWLVTFFLIGSLVLQNPQFRNSTTLHFSLISFYSLHQFCYVNNTDALATPRWL